MFGSFDMLNPIIPQFLISVAIHHNLLCPKELILIKVSSMINLSNFFLFMLLLWFTILNPFQTETWFCLIHQDNSLLPEVRFKDKSKK
jgi:hypothetical protein